MPKQNRNQGKNQKNASNVAFLHLLDLWGDLESSLLRKEKSSLLATFCPEKTPAHTIPFLQSSCAGKAPSFPMILMCFDGCLWDSLNSVKLSRVGQTSLGQKCQASINHHVQCLNLNSVFRLEGKQRNTANP